MSICSAISSALFEYNTNKIVHIRSKTIGIVNRLIQATIICYVIIYVIIYNKGYQETETPYSSVTTKLKGTAITNLTGNVNLPFYGGIHVWDSSDYVIPAEEKDEFFVMTNMIISPNQTQGTCPEDPKLSKCTSDAECTPFKEVQYGHGYQTGKCVPADRGNTSVHVCEIYGWCPVEIDETPMPGFHLRPGVPLIDIREFTVLIKNTVQFPTFGESKRNIDPSDNGLKSCQYDKEKQPFCPIFKLGTIIKETGADFDQLTFEGGVVAIIITWDCDFDSLTYSCQPKYSFRRLDSVKTPIAAGYNFRYATKFVQGDKLYRSLFKAYGVRFVILVYGQGGRFSVVPLFLNLGSGLALLGVATVLCDIVVLYLLPKKTFYREKKYFVVDEEKALLSKETRLPSYSNARTNESFQEH